MINSWREVDAAINKLIQKVEDLYRQVMYTNSSQIGNQTTVNGDATFNGLVTIRAPKILCLSSGNEPTDTDASGVFMSAAGETFGSDTYNIGGVDNGGLQFGIRSTDGVGVFSGGDAEIGADGIVIDKMGYLMSHTATDGTTERTGSMGMWAEPGGTAPQYGIAFNAPGGSELITNGDAETGDLTGWTGTANVSANSTTKYAGAYSFRMKTYDNATDTLTSDAISFSGGSFILSLKHAFFNSYLRGYTSPAFSTTAKIEVKYYDAADALLRTDTIVGAYSTNSSAWNNVYVLITPPSITSYFKIVATVTAPDYTILFPAQYYADLATTYYGFFVDNVSLINVPVSSNLYFDSTGELCLNGSPALPKHCYISTIAMTSSATLTTYSANPAYKYTTAANAGNGDTFALTVPPLAAGTYSIYFCGNKHNVRGKVDWTLDGTSIVTGQDWYASGATEYTFQVDSVSVTSGAHTLAGTINGKNASSSDYSLALYSVVFVKTA